MVYLFTIKIIKKMNIQINDQILASKGESLLIATVTEIREKCVKIDYCWESVWSGGLITRNYE